MRVRAMDENFIVDGKSVAVAVGAGEIGRIKAVVI